MNLFLVQHGSAVSREVDPNRPLSPEGEADVRRISDWIAAAEVTIPEVWHSGKTRAAQTAARLAAALIPPPTLTAAPGLGPKDDIRPVAEEISERGTPVMIVGHLPFLSRLAGLLVVGDPACEVVRFRNAALVCLERAPDGRWAIAWAVPPCVAAVRVR